MNKLSNLFMLILLGTVLVFSSCNKDNDLKKEDYKDKKDYCYELIFPVSYIMPDGSTITANDKESVELEMKVWYEAHPNVDEKAKLKYPVNVSYGEGIEKVIENEADMKWAGEACDEKEWDKDFCFAFVYPITFVVPNKGSSITVESEEALEEALKNWYENNPDSEEKLELQYPVNISFDDNLIKTIENDLDMEWAKKACDEEAWDKKLCFELVYPINFIMPDGSTVSGDNEESLWIGLKDWYEAHPDSEEKPQVQYPVEIIYEDGTTQSISTEEEMIAAKKDC